MSRVYDGTRPCECRHVVHGTAAGHPALDPRICAPAHYDTVYGYSRLLYVCGPCLLQHEPYGRTDARQETAA